MKKISIIVIGICFIFVSASIFSVIYLNLPDSYSETTAPVRLADDTNYTAERLGSLVDSLNNFSFNFYNHVSEGNNSNIFFSPYSIFVALSMAYEGARGNTAAEMSNILNILQNDSATKGSFARIYNLLNQKQEGYKISTANAFWANQNYKFLPEYISILQNYYMAEAHELDFSDNEQASDIINTWIELKTNNKIKDMIDPNALSELTAMVLTNAIYFKGLWEFPFDPQNTTESDFKTTNNETTKVNMMSLYNTKFNYTETSDLQILKLPYSGNDLSMIIVLPKENNISVAESELSAENLAEWNDKFNEIKIDVKIPRFTFTSDYNLNDILKQMGMVDAFERTAADFSGMDGTRSLFISDVLHKAFVQVNEEGTEAAAATAVIVTMNANTDSFTADHPFVFLIQHEQTGAVLFMGKVMAPVE